VTFLCTCDEEIGSGGSRKLIEAVAQEADAVLVVEPSLHGALKTARKGVGVIEVRVKGRASHAGGPEIGVNAVEELAVLLADIKALQDPAAGTTLNVGTFHGGTRYNVVAAEATAEVDVRVKSATELARITTAVETLQPRNPEASISVTGSLRWPPMERSEGGAELFERARAVGRAIGLDLSEAAVGGASDGNFCAALGVPVLDGLGAVGGGAHASNEHVVCDAIPVRAALVAGLIRRLSEETDTA
jgi:glutamate carboxypeptidase